MGSGQNWIGFSISQKLSVLSSKIGLSGANLMGYNVYQTFAGISHALFSPLMCCQQGALSRWLCFYSEMQIQNLASGDITRIGDTLLKNISSTINQ